MATPRDLKVQMAAETRARERAQALAKAEAARAARAESALADMTADRDRWKARAQAFEPQAVSGSESWQG
ncbi:MAG: hypothetical protein K2Y56_00570 [Methylobacterium sp.]|uniref:hypothetical protein n=1 Tax=Methylobacterium sp. TaxID=409 RepID=UPI0026008B34|nr:hypothetical protein [Methylobacterium sp.]MBX9930032.1 hypothetical protein [Methylobacterium sp.]